MKNLYVLILLGFIFSCSSSEDTAPPLDLTPGAALVYTTANIDGAMFNASISSDITIPSDYGSSYSYQRQFNNNGGCININYTASLFPTLNDVLPYVGVGFIGFMSEANLTCSDELENFDSLFPAGSYSYAENESTYGAKIEHATASDGSGNFYTSYGPQDSSASFVIGTFSCTLYNESDNTDTINVTDGTFKLSMKSFN